MLNAILIGDMVITFRTSRLNLETGEEISDPKHIARSYLTSIWFTIDLLCIIPFDMFAKRDLLVLFNLLKIIKVGRFNKIIHNLNTTSYTKTVTFNISTLLTLFIAS